GWGKEPHGALYPTALIVRALAALDPADPAVEAGAAYLEARRNNDAGWYDRGLAAETTLRVAETLAALGRRDALAAAGRWMEKLVPLNQAARAGRFSFLLRYTSITPEEKSRTLAELLAAEGPAGGWGCAPGYESDLLTTATVLRALWDAGYADPGIYRRTVEFIRSRQRADGGFNLMPGEPGQIYVTAHLLLTLARLRPLAAVEAVTEPAAAWLLAERRADGSWGRGVLDTALAFAAVADRLSVEEAEAIRRYLELAQETDGSWENDALATALVLAALDLIRPNPRVTAEGIAFAPQVVYYRDPAAVTVTVENGGLAAAENLVVRLHLGGPEDGTVLATEVIPVIPARETRSVTFPWNADILGANRFTVTLDPEEVLRETREDDNVAAKILRVLPKIDLAASSEDLHITPEDPGPAEILTIRAVVRNLGCLPAGEFTVAFYDAAPEAGGRLIATATCAGLPAGGAVEATVTATLPEGEYNIYAVVDPENLVAEDDEGNNLASMALTVKRRIDLAINTNNIIFSHEKPLEGDEITIYATVANRREDAAEAVPVAFYLGNPADGGLLLGRSVLDHLAGNSTGLAVCTFDTTGLSGPQVIYVTVDPDGALAEVDEHNNQALNVVYVTPRPDLVVTGITAGTMTEGVPGSISITIKNDGGSTAGACKVRLALDDASLADVLGDVALGAINPGATATINLTLDTVALAGAHIIYVKVDAANEVNEKNETNNTAAASFTINPAPELSVEPAEISFVSPGKKRVIEHIATKDDSYISAVDAGGTNYNTCTNAKLAVAGGTPVTISVWARGERGGEAIELLLFEYPGPAASGRILASKVFNITAEWREYSLTAVTGTNAVAAWGRLDNDRKDQVVYWCDPRLLNADFTDGFAFVRTSDTYLLRFFTANNGTCRIEPSVGFPQ
ncbi:MAG: hypothetical protein GX493_10060, partial [Firmicutes bacterium]|nr:hypothetical protein [Bacillota bacterium]